MYCGTGGTATTFGEHSWPMNDTARFAEITWVFRNSTYSGTTTRVPDWYSNPVRTWYSETIRVLPPKHWRWFDCFRTHAPYLAPAAGTTLTLRPRRAQSRRCLIQVLRTKRRNFVHNLRKTLCKSI